MKSIIQSLLINCILLLLILPLRTNAETAIDTVSSIRSLQELPTLEIIGGGFVCAQDTYHLELRLTGTSPYTILYALDGVIQEALQLTSSSIVWALPESMSFDTLSIFGISNELGIGSIFGTNFLIVTRTLIPIKDTIICVPADQTYSVEIDFELFENDVIVLIDGENAIVQDKRVQIGPLPIEQDYAVTISSTLRCDTIELRGSSPCMLPCADFMPFVSLSPAENILCEGTSVRAEIMGADKVLWIDGGGQTMSEGLTFEWELMLGIHENIQIVVESGDCMDTLFLNWTITKQYSPEPDFLIISQPDCGEDNGIIRLSDTFIAYFDQIILQPLGGEGVLFDRLSPGKYTLEAVHPYCPLVFPVELISAVCDIFIPTAFTPNGDGINDRFEVNLPPKGGYQLIQLEIFDRWGNIIFKHDPSNNNASPGWNGEYSGKPMDPGLYTYWILIEDSAGEVSKYAGTVTLIR
jgi:gliding motility-associated-like protein